MPVPIILIIDQPQRANFVKYLKYDASRRAKQAITAGVPAKSA